VILLAVDAWQLIHLPEETIWLMLSRHRRQDRNGIDWRPTEAARAAAAMALAGCARATNNTGREVERRLHALMVQEGSSLSRMDVQSSVTPEGKQSCKILINLV